MRQVPPSATAREHLMREGSSRRQRGLCDGQQWFHLARHMAPIMRHIAPHHAWHLRLWRENMVCAMALGGVISRAAWRRHAPHCSQFVSGWERVAPTWFARLPWVVSGRAQCDLNVRQIPSSMSSHGNFTCQRGIYLHRCNVFRRPWLPAKFVLRSAAPSLKKLISP